MTAKKAKALGRPQIGVRLGAGYSNYYLHFGMVGLDVNIYPLPVLSIDLGADIWLLTLLEEDVNGELDRTARGLPAFHLGAAYRSNFHKIIRPYAGAELGAVMYAQKVEGGTVDGGGARTPLFGFLIAGKVGVDFVVTKLLGFFVGAKVGVGLTGDIEQDGIPDIQQYVDAAWSPTKIAVNVRGGAFLRF